MIIFHIEERRDFHYMNSEISMCSYSSNLIATPVILPIKSHMPCRAKTVKVSMHARNILKQKSQWP